MMINSEYELEKESQNHGSSLFLIANFDLEIDLLVDLKQKQDRN